MFGEQIFVKTETVTAQCPCSVSKVHSVLQVIKYARHLFTFYVFSAVNEYNDLK